MDALENDRIERQEKVKQTINKSYVNADGQDDRLCEQQTKRTRNILLQQLSKIDFDFLLLGMDAPVLRSPA